MTTTKDPYTGYNFRVDVAGFPFGGYTYVDGLDLDIDIEEISEAGRNESTIKLVGQAKPRPLRLKKGLTDARVLQEWIEEVVIGINSGNANFKRSVSVVQLDNQGVVIRTWDVRNVFPNHYRVGPWNSKESVFTQEEITLYHDGWI